MKGANPTLNHLDLFSGIGGFSYAADTVWDNIQHTFCEWDEFCQQVLKKHWPESEVHSDIKNITDAKRSRWEREGSDAQRQHRQLNRTWKNQRPFLLTGGFPCQPFSAAGVRRGTSDERYLWPEMYRVIQLTQPTWVIAENVRGLATWEQGMVLEQVCADLEASGYEVQPLIIPAVAVNAPHRRDRIWFLGHTKHDGRNGAEDSQSGQEGNGGDSSRPEQLQQPKGTNTLRFDAREWERDWMEIATEFCSVDDGLPVQLGEFKLSKAQHRNQQLKAYGNAIVPQVAVEIMKGIKLSIDTKEAE